MHEFMSLLPFLWERIVSGALSVPKRSGAVIR
jgi:hypothetical protein